RHFEDILQCCIPVFDGLLFPPHNKAILDLLFDMATWHTYAKLRQHTEYTLRSFEAKTRELGDQLRHFSQSTCPSFPTKELPGEAAARGHRRVANQKMRALSGKQPTKQPQDNGGAAKSVKTFSLSMSKVHALGDYPGTIRQLGTTDSYSTQRVSVDEFEVNESDSSL
ncbi:hypothetical protein BDM02DRAFT_3233219, partial [Thelephora ganbajun]